MGAERDRGPRVLGIDPGSYVTGWGVLDPSARRPTRVASGTIRLTRAWSQERRLHALGASLIEVIERYAPSIAAVEAPFSGINARSALQLAHARGAILAVLGGASIDVVEIAPATVKRAVVGTGRADKRQVQHMIVRLLDEADVEIGDVDESDALAIAWCCATTYATVAGAAAGRATRSRSRTRWTRVPER